MIKLMEIFKPTVVLSKNDKPISQKSFSSSTEAKKYIKLMVKKHQLSRQKGFWGNPKTRVELITNF